MAKIVLKGGEHIAGREGAGERVMFFTSLLCPNKDSRYSPSLMYLLVLLVLHGYSFLVKVLLGVCLAMRALRLVYFVVYYCINTSGPNRISNACVVIHSRSPLAARLGDTCVYVRKPQRVCGSAKTPHFELQAMKK